MLYTELTSSAQKEALERFKAKGFPTNKWEEWKYASLKSWNEKDLDWTPASLHESSTANLQTQNGNTTISLLCSGKPINVIPHIFKDRPVNLVLFSFDFL